MERKKLKNILLKHYSLDMTKSIMCGRQKPSYIKMLVLHKEGIPFWVWQDIKSYLQENDTTPQTRAQELPSVTGCDGGNSKEKDEK